VCYALLVVERLAGEFHRILGEGAHREAALGSFAKLKEQI